MVDLWTPDSYRQRRAPQHDPRVHQYIGMLESRLADLEYDLHLSREWDLLTGKAGEQFDKRTINDIADIARVMALKNPLIKRAIAVKSAYTFGQGVQISAAHERINEVVQSFLDDERNQSELTTHQAMLNADKDVQCDGNRFFVLFTNRQTGRVRVRSIPLKEIVHIECNPEDRKEPYYYLRTWLDGNQQPQQAAYPDFRYTPRARPATVDIVGHGTFPVRWDAPVYHVKIGAFSNWNYGLSDLFSAQDWAKAYNRFLEDVATYMATLSLFAAKVTTGGGKAGIAKAQDTFASSISASDGYETNPAPAPGGVFIRSQGANGPTADYEPIKVAGMSISPEDGRRFLLMVCAATDMPETFLGDVSVGTLATAKSLDRPTELLMQNRQRLWQDILLTILRYVIKQSVLATNGKLTDIADAIQEPDDDEIITRLEWRDDPETGEPYDTSIAVSFPPVVDIDVNERVEAIVNAATLDGHASAGQVMDMRTISRLMLEALGVDEVDDVLRRLYPDGEDGIEAPDTVGTISDMLALVQAEAIDIGTLQRWLGVQDVAALQSRIDQEKAAAQQRFMQQQRAVVRQQATAFDQPDGEPEEDEGDATD